MARYRNKVIGETPVLTCPQVWYHSLLYLIAGGRMVVNWGWQSMIQLFLVIAVVGTLVTIWFAFEDYRRVVPIGGNVSVGA